MRECEFHAFASTSTKAKIETNPYHILSYVISGESRNGSAHFSQKVNCATSKCPGQVRRDNPYKELEGGGAWDFIDMEEIPHDDDIVVPAVDTVNDCGGMISVVGASLSLSPSATKTGD